MRTQKLTPDGGIRIDREDNLHVGDCGEVLRFLDLTGVGGDIPADRRAATYAMYAKHFWRLSLRQEEQLRRGLERALELRRRWESREAEEAASQ
jgi:hypothetical protein